MALVKRKTGVIAAGLALFSMFFGAGDLIWPLILGGQAGDKNLYAMLGLLITGVTLPLLGLLAMMLFEGNYRSFFNQTGRIPGIILIFLIQAILGPLGSLPRLVTLAHATLSPYFPSFMTLPLFSVVACLLVFVFTVRRQQVVDLIGLILCPFLLLSLGAIVVLGCIHPPAQQVMTVSNKESFFQGLHVGYNTLDLIASFIFAPLVLAYFISDEKGIDTKEAKRRVFGKMIKACLISGGLLAAMFAGLTYVASHYTPVLGEHAPEERLAVISLHLLGTKGAFLSCLAVSLSCLTTAIPISIITAEYIHKDFMREKGSMNTAVAISLGLSMLVANLGFMGIASLLSPVLQILCPGLIILCILNILHKLYEMRMHKAPVFAAFAISVATYLVRL
ncbi:MAG: Branched-chain amino acid transport system 2 carrier protein [Chlamydiales bacterium]|nr:Branched-chain amino acid transport system 2 carrier protein [Chlamydiales bacterium]